uniref:Uncharacterized protein n=1 Tax=Eutreptiella gymnastica TaxID=73025 RepID=A0A7S4G8H9_9EUGL
MKENDRKRREKKEGYLEYHRRGAPTHIGLAQDGGEDGIDACALCPPFVAGHLRHQRRHTLLVGLPAGAAHLLPSAGQDMSSELFRVVRYTRDLVLAGGG